MTLPTKPIFIPQRSRPLQVLDSCLRPLMRLISGALQEEPQSTHRWNYHFLSAREVDFLKIHFLIRDDGKKSAEQLFKYVIPTHHLTFIGGWKEYVVLTPDAPEEGWYVGWLRSDSKAVSQIKLYTPVRMLVGPVAVDFFALSGAFKQIKITEIDRGQVGDGGVFRQLPLL